MTDQILQYPLVPLRDMVVFPSMMAPFVVGRRASIQALEATLGTNEKKIFLATQRDPKVDDPSMEEIYQIGIVATVVQNLKLPNQNVKVMVEGLTRAEIVSSQETDGYTTVGVREIDTKVALTGEISQYMQKLVDIFEQYAKMSHHLAFEGVMSTLKLDDADLVDLVHGRVVDFGVALRGQENLLLGGGQRRLERQDGRPAADDERRHHRREDDHVAQRHEGELSYFWFIRHIGFLL